MENRKLDSNASLVTCNQFTTYLSEAANNKFKFIPIED